MQINPIGSNAGVQASAITTQSASQPTAGVGAKDFQQVMEQVGGVPKLLGLELHKDIAKLQSSAVSGKALSTQELLYYQIKANEFNLRVELTSKVAESAISTTKRLQQAQ